MSQTIELAKQLIACPSLTPSDAGCQTILAHYLEQLGFTVESLSFGNVSNLWARIGTKAPLFVFAGHTDVVPPGPTDQWQNPPFSPTIINDTLYGRGAADMKGSLAAMVVACSNFLKDSKLDGSIAFLITSDEEGDAVNGTDKVVSWLESTNQVVDYCVVGEASSENTIGDTIKVGRRGSLTGYLSIFGIQGHVAYPEKADNPVHKIAPFLKDFVSKKWDKGNKYFGPTTCQIAAINAGTGAANVIPSHVDIVFNFRYSPASTPDKLKNTIIALLEKHHLKYQLSWRHNANPFLSKNGKLVDAVTLACQELCQSPPVLSTTGGTSDGRFIIRLGCELIELGVRNETIHKIDENVAVADLEILTKLYERILEKLFLS